MYEIKQKTIEKAVIYCKVTKSTYTLNCIRTDVNFGNFYIFNSLFEMPSLRHTAFDMIREFHKLGIDADDLRKDHEDIKKIVLEAQPSEKYYKSALHEIYNIIAQQEAKIKNYWGYLYSEMLIATLFIVPENQLTEIGFLNQNLCEKNLKEWSKDNEMLNFFFQLARTNLNNSIKKLDSLSRINTGTTAV